jgi:23S rRNA (pseudouridine1915-N3)-methyltransferase
MKLVLLMTGKTDQAWIREGVAEYEKRISRYTRFELITLPDVKNPGNRSAATVKEKEAEKMLSAFKSDDHVVLLDENGKGYSTIALADYIRSAMMLPKKRMVFVIGGPWGFHQSVRDRLIISFHSQISLFAPGGTIIVRGTALQGAVGDRRRSLSS